MCACKCEPRLNRPAADTKKLKFRLPHRMSPWPSQDRPPNCPRRPGERPKNCASQCKRETSIKLEQSWLLKVQAALSRVCNTPIYCAVGGIADNAAEYPASFAQAVFCLGYCPPQRSAELLGIHRNTLAYRQQRIRDELCHYGGFAMGVPFSRKRGRPELSIFGEPILLIAEKAQR